MLKILLTNDDGYDAVGIKALIKALSKIAKIMVVAPAKNKSACGHSLTLDRPLRLISTDDDFYKIDDATPTDCIYLSLGNLLQNGYKPDLIISGINIGANMGEDITYSGTCGAAMESVLHNVPAIAISQVCKDMCRDIITDWDFELACKIIVDIVKKIEDKSFPLEARKFLNINIPPLKVADFKGIKITRVGHREYGNNSARHTNPRGEEYYWIGLPSLSWKESKDKSCDFEAIKDGYVSITPIMLDMTAYQDIENLKDWINR